MPLAPDGVKVRRKRGFHRPHTGPGGLDRQSEPVGGDLRNWRTRRRAVLSVTSAIVFPLSRPLRDRQSEPIVAPHFAGLERNMDSIESDGSPGNPVPTHWVKGGIGTGANRIRPAANGPSKAVGRRYSGRNIVSRSRWGEVSSPAGGAAGRDKLNM